MALHEFQCIQWTLRITDTLQLVHRLLSFIRCMSFIGVFYSGGESHVVQLCASYIRRRTLSNCVITCIHQQLKLKPPWSQNWNGAGKLRIGLSNSLINLHLFTSIFCSCNSGHHLSFWVWKPSSCNACCSHSRWSWWLHAVAYYSHCPLHALLW